MATVFHTSGGFETMVHAYAVCALWSSIDDSGNPFDDWASPDDLTEETRATMREECADFLAYCKASRTPFGFMRADSVGHDFWLTRNGHGAGFWDRGLGERGRRLTEAAKTFGTVYLFETESGEVAQA